MSGEHLVRVSKYLARILRHRPGAVGVTLDEAGWADVDALLAACEEAGFPITRAELDHLVEVNDKQRFAFDETGRRIRANQGHTVPVDLGLDVVAPPPVLYHGTVAAALPAIRTSGLRPMNRHDVQVRLSAISLLPLRPSKWCGCRVDCGWVPSRSPEVPLVGPRR